MMRNKNTVVNFCLSIILQLLFCVSAGLHISCCQPLQCSKSCVPCGVCTCVCVCVFAQVLLSAAAMLEELEPLLQWSASEGISLPSCLPQLKTMALALAAAVPSTGAAAGHAQGPLQAVSVAHAGSLAHDTVRRGSYDTGACGHVSR